MKKTYQCPEMSAFYPYVACGPALVAGSATGSDTLSKDRSYDEDNDAYNVTGGAGEASYGDLW